MTQSCSVRGELKYQRQTWRMLSTLGMSSNMMVAETSSKCPRSILAASSTMVVYMPTILRVYVVYMVVYMPTILGVYVVYMVVYMPTILRVYVVYMVVYMPTILRVYAWCTWWCTYSRSCVFVFRLSTHVKR